jgi:large subunit ribosomal protein L35
MSAKRVMRSASIGLAEAIGDVAPSSGAPRQQKAIRKYAVMPKQKTHKGMKKRFKISATGKVSHKRCGSSHLMSHKSGKRVRRLRKTSTLEVAAESRRIRHAMLDKQGSNPEHVAALKQAAIAAQKQSSQTPKKTETGGQHPAK